jgi:hypothetical protein
MAGNTFAKGRDISASQLPAGMSFELNPLPPLAGRYAGAAEEFSGKKKTPIEKTKEAMEAMGLDPNSTMGGMFAMNLLQKYEEQDPDRSTFKEEADYFFKKMQEQAEHAQKLGERSTIIGGLIDSSKQGTFDRQYAFFPEQLEAIRASISRPQFFNRVGISEYL